MIERWNSASAEYAGCKIVRSISPLASASITSRRDEKSPHRSTTARLACGCIAPTPSEERDAVAGAVLGSDDERNRPARQLQLTKLLQSRVGIGPRRDVIVDAIAAFDLPPTTATSSSSRLTTTISGRCAPGRDPTTRNTYQTSVSNASPPSGTQPAEAAQNKTPPGWSAHPQLAICHRAPQSNRQLATAPDLRSALTVRAHNHVPNVHRTAAAE